MTHSGGKPHQVGDRGQRYEVTFMYEGEEQVLGWTDDKDRHATAHGGDDV